MAVALIRADDALIPSTGLAELQAVFYGFQRPYSAADARAFTRCYREHYREMSCQERAFAEAMVDQLIEGLDRPEDRRFIFGVV